MTNPVQSFYFPPGTTALPRIERADGPYLWDTDGRRYLDAASGPVVTNIGHGNARVIEAMKRQLDACAFASRTAFVSDANAELAEKLAALCGPGLDACFPTAGGSEAIETCLKFARQVAVTRGEAGRWKVLARNPSYHGSTLGALSVTGDDEAEAVFGPMMAPMPKFPAPFTYRVPDGETAETWPGRTLDILEERILSEGPQACLAVIVEPVGGLATGALVSDGTYYRRLRALCDHYGLFLIFDEIMSGAGRTGRFLAADHWSDARPDIVGLAKGLSAGYAPLGAMMASRSMVEEVAASGGFLHGHTYVANPLSCAAGVAVLDETRRLGLIENASRMGDALRDSLERVAAASPIVGNVRGKGLLMAIELVADKASKALFPLDVDITRRLGQAAMQNGLIVYARRTSRGVFGEWVMICPPLTIDETVLGELETRLADTLSAVVSDLHSDGHLRAA
ncbi:MAG: aminotransferase class III-fold pyridoxal phosphate-dependent enzyme [Pseudomonadota bacterium]